MALRPGRDEIQRLQRDYPEEFRRFCVHIAAFEGWRSMHNPDGAVEQVRRILNSGRRKGHAPRNFDIDWAIIALDFFHDEGFSFEFARRRARADLRRESEAEQTELSRVRKVGPERVRRAS